MGDGGAGRRFTSPAGVCEGTVAFPEGNVTADPAAAVDCAYTTEFFLTVDTDPTAAATGNGSLTPSGWHPVGTTVSLTADATVAAGPGSRFDLRSWEVDGAASGPSLTVTDAHTATAQRDRSS